MRLGLPPGDLLHTPSTCFGCRTRTDTGFSSNSRMQTTKRIAQHFRKVVVQDNYIAQLSHKVVVQDNYIAQLSHKVVVQDN